MKDYQIGLYEKAMPTDLTWPEKLRCAKELGYDFLEMSVDETDERLHRLDWTAQERTALLRDMRAVGLPVRSMCLSAHRKYPFGSTDPDCRARSMEIMHKALQLADELGIRMIQLAGYDVYYEEGTEQSRKYFRENLQAATELAAKYGILLGFETMETLFMNTVGKAMAYVKQVNSPYLGVYPDCGNLTNAAMSSGDDILKDLASGRGHLMALHLKETVPGKFRNIPFLTGHVDFQAVIPAAWALGVRRYVTELWYLGQPLWKEDILFAWENMSRILDTLSNRKGVDQLVGSTQTGNL